MKKRFPDEDGTVGRTEDIFCIPMLIRR